MVKFLSGILWTAFVTPIFIICLVVPGEQRGGADMNPFLFIFFVLFEFIGLYMLISGFKKIIKDMNTKKYGIQCYGIIKDIQTTGTYINNKPEFKVILDFVNPETYQIENIDEIIGFDYNKYPINSYILCKYYQGDINLENIINEDKIPGNIKKFIPKTQKNLTFGE